MKFPIPCLAIALLLSARVVLAQEDSVNENFLKVYLDGVSYYSDHIRTEIPFVNYVRDRFEAQVHILVTSISTGSGGTDYTLFYKGQHEFEGKDDTLHYIANTNNTEDETRNGLIQVMKMGLMQYIAKLPTPTGVTISFESSTIDSEEKQVEDRWDGWVYSVGVYGSLSLSKYYHSYNISGDLSADKTNEEWKIQFNAGWNSKIDNYDFGDGFHNRYENSAKYSSGSIVNSMTEHWSIGGDANYYAGTYNNYKLSLSAAPAIEYDIFPYDESTRKLFTFYYTAGPLYAVYNDTTVYGKTEELLFQERLDVYLALKQPWGSAVVGVYGSNYLHDFAKNSFGCSSSFSWRVFEGFSVFAYFYLDIIHDQLNLPAGGATEEEILLQLSEIQTDYSFYTYFGISYTFGSIFNNVVNPRFDRN